MKGSGGGKGDKKIIESFKKCNKTPNEGSLLDF